MIKRFRFAWPYPGGTSQACAAALRRAAAAVAMAPAGTGPLRVSLCTVLPEFTAQPTGHDHWGYDVVSIEWFPDVAGLERFGRWLASPRGREASQRLDAALPRGASVAVVADERVTRGADWLERRWSRGDNRSVFKHMALARRAPGLSPGEFARRWAAHAGAVRPAGAAAPTPIPEPIRGRAYVQNHPCPRDSGEWPYDAVNEVFFDDLAGLRARVEWFRDTVAGGTDTELFAEPRFLAVREEVLVA